MGRRRPNIAESGGASHAGFHRHGPRDSVAKLRAVARRVSALILLVALIALMIALMIVLVVV